MAGIEIFRGGRPIREVDTWELYIVERDICYAYHRLSSKKTNLLWSLLFEKNYYDYFEWNKLSPSERQFLLEGVLIIICLIADDCFSGQGGAPPSFNWTDCLNAIDVIPGLHGRWQELADYTRSAVRQVIEHESSECLVTFTLDRPWILETFIRPHYWCMIEHQSESDGTLFGKMQCRTKGEIPCFTASKSSYAGVQMDTHCQNVIRVSHGSVPLRETSIEEIETIIRDICYGYHSIRLDGGDLPWFGVLSKRYYDYFEVSGVSQETKNFLLTGALVLITIMAWDGIENVSASAERFDWMECLASLEAMSNETGDKRRLLSYAHSSCVQFLQEEKNILKDIKTIPVDLAWVIQHFVHSFFRLRAAA